MRRDLDDILKHALTPKEEPDFWMNQRILSQAEEEKQMTNKKMRKIPAVLAAVLILGVGSLTAAAAWKYLAPDKTAQEMENQKLAAAFQSKDAVTVNETQRSGNYKITLLGIVSGKDITEFVTECDGEVADDRTYVVTAIERADGTPMPKISDEDYGEEAFFVSPLIEGYNPARYNSVTMNGGYQEMEKDGILYRISECDNVEAFADHKIYLCVNDGSFYNTEAYHFDEKTGAISKNEEYQGVNALFNLPFNKEKADPKKAKEYIRNLEKEMEDGGEVTEETEVDRWLDQITPDNIEQYAKRLEETVQILTPDADGLIYVDWEARDSSGSDENSLEGLFPDGKPGMSKSMFCSSSGDKLEEALLETFTLNEDGTVTFAIYVPK